MSTKNHNSLVEMHLSFVQHGYILSKWVHDGYDLVWFRFENPVNISNIHQKSRVSHTLYVI